MRLDFKDESGIFLRGGCAIAFLIGLIVGLILGLIYGVFTGEWYIASACGFLLLINIIINIISFIIDKIKTNLANRKRFKKY